MRQGIFHQSASSADSLTVSVQPPCAIANTNICAQKIPDIGSQTGTTKILHTLVGMGSAALVAAVPYPNLPHGAMKYWNKTKRCLASNFPRVSLPLRKPANLRLRPQGEKKTVN